MKKLSIKGIKIEYELFAKFVVLLVILFLIIETTQFYNMKLYLYKNKMEVLQSSVGLDAFQIIKTTVTQEDLKLNSHYLVSSIEKEGIGALIIDRQGNILEKANMSMDHGKRLPSIVPILDKESYISIVNEPGKFKGRYIIIRQRPEATDEVEDSILVTFIKIGIPHSPAGLIQLSINIHDIEAILYKQLIVNIVIFIALLTIGALLSKRMFRKTLMPLNNMTKILENNDTDYLNIRFDEQNRQEEINKLSVAFNKMVSKIQSSFEKEQETKEKMRRFVSHASHELRTPLTSIYGFAQVLSLGAAKDESNLDTGLNCIMSESERLTKLVNDLLLLTKIDENIPIKMECEDLSKVINETLPSIKIIAASRIIDLDLKENIFVYINKNKFKQVILNLVQNAISHTNEVDGVIGIFANEKYINKTLYARIIVKDNGEGISKEHIKFIFDRFYRNESHRSRKHGGYGLGLSIVKSIVEAHGGKIKVISEMKKGTAFVVYLKA